MPQYQPNDTRREQRKRDEHWRGYVQRVHVASYMQYRPATLRREAVRPYAPGTDLSRKATTSLHLVSRRRHQPGKTGTHTVNLMDTKPFALKFLSHKKRGNEIR